MRLSQVAAEFSEGGSFQIGFLPKDGIGRFVRERGLSPTAGRAVSVAGKDVAGLLQAQSMQEIEERVNGLLAAVRAAPADKDPELQRSASAASAATDSYELHYMASMFVHQRAVIRALAKNPHLSERTQLQIAMDPDLITDREVALSLAHNPALSARVMRTLLARTDDRFVWQGVARNAAGQSRRSLGPDDFSAICEEMVGSWEDSVAKVAIPGIKSGDMLRTMYDQCSVLSSPDRLLLIAQNPSTPDDVLDKMTNSPFAGMQRLVGITVPEQARLTLATKRQAPRADAAPSMSM